MDPAPSNKNTDGGWTQANRKRKGAGRGAPHRGRGSFRNNSKRRAVDGSGSKILPNPSSSQSASPAVAKALNKPTFKAVATGEDKLNVPGWVLRTGGDQAKNILSREAKSLPKSRLITLQVNGVFHNIDVLRLTPQGVRAVQLLQNEIRGLEMPTSKVNELNSADTSNSRSPVAGPSKVTEHKPSNQDAPQDPEALKIRVDETKVGSFTHVTCPTCGTETVAEMPKPDITRLSGRTSARRYLRYRMEKANTVLAKLHDAERELEARFDQADQKARDLALAKAEALERLAQAKRSKVEAEKSKVAATHYQDPMDVENEEEIVLSQSKVGRVAAMGTPIGAHKLTTAESIAIRKSHMVGGSRTAPLGKQTAPPAIPFSFPTPPPAITESLLTQFFTVMQQSMARTEEVVKKLSEEVLTLKSQNLSRSPSTSNLVDTSTMRIGSILDFPVPGSEVVEVMSVTVDQPMDQDIDPEPSSPPSDTIELGCSNDDLLAADSEEETEVTQDDDHLLSESEEETEPPPEEPTVTRWEDDE